MKLFTLSKSGVPLLDGEPIDGPVLSVIDDIEAAEDAKA